MQLHSPAHQSGPEDGVDEPHRKHAPDCKTNRGRNGTDNKEVENGRYEDERGADGRHHGGNCCNESPQDRIGDAKERKANAAQDSLNETDENLTFHDRVHGKREVVEDHFVVAVLKRTKRDNEASQTRAVSKEVVQSHEKNESLQKKGTDPGKRRADMLCEPRYRLPGVDINVCGKLGDRLIRTR